MSVSPHRRLGSLCLAFGLVKPQNWAFHPITVPSSQRPWSPRSAHMRNRYTSTSPSTPPWGLSLGRQPSHREPDGGMAWAMTVLSATIFPSTWNITHSFYHYYCRNSKCWVCPHWHWICSTSFQFITCVLFLSFWSSSLSVTIRSHTSEIL